MQKTYKCERCKAPKPLEDFPNWGGARRTKVCHQCGGTKSKSAQAEPPTAESVTCDVSDDRQAITINSKTVRTLDEALKKCRVDLDVWEVERWVANKWEMGAKLKTTVDHDSIENIAVTELWQVKVWLRRKVSQLAETAFGILARKAVRHVPKYGSAKLKPPTAPHLLVIGIYDAHFGKLAWARETGENYDLSITEKIYAESVRSLIAKAGAFRIGQILFPFGNDFFNIDTIANTTTGGTAQDTDGRYAKIMASGQMAAIKAVDYCLGIAPVHIILVPGNHDAITSWHLVSFLEAWYRNNPRVTVDSGPSPRKYYRYGSTLIGLTHGNEEKHVSLPNLMATERPDLWAKTTTHEWQLGHFHKSKATEHVSVDTHDGVVVRVLPSISGRDAWHHRKGYVGRRAAEAYLYDKKTGYAGHFSANVPNRLAA
jgi:hypothetical protein